MKHSKGPWNTRYIGVSTPVDNAYTSVYDVVDADGQLVATVTHPDHAVIAAAPELLTALQIAYTILADIRHEWPGRSTAEGQGALVAMREAIAKATDRKSQDVQDEYTNAKLAA